MSVTQQPHRQAKKDPAALTHRESMIVAMTAQGKTPHEIADALGARVDNIKKALKIIAEKRECQ